MRPPLLLLAPAALAACAIAPKPPTVDGTNRQTIDTPNTGKRLRQPATTGNPAALTSPIDDGASPRIIPTGCVSAADSLTDNTTPAGRALYRRGGVPIEPLEGQPK
ncbi:MAG: hypothetical protein LBS70_05460 [Candidatus Accumulibacter sp.]|jgi:hypothetical protein|nr:hypothetical protein [Accumulibacter sp.]